jgi:transcriptional regulator with XRE-family HTH domain
MDMDMVDKILDKKEHIGLKIRALRKSMKATLDTLSLRTGLTKGYLSKIERGQQSPPIATLSRIADALNVGIADFLERKQEDVRCCIVRSTERKIIPHRGAMFGYSYESLAHKKHDKLMNPFVITLIPHANDRTIFRHAGQEFMFVLQGRMEFWYDDEKHILNVGDCVCFDSDTPHRAQCVDDKESKILVVICNSYDQK